jgi:hypothetical protein
VRRGGGHACDCCKTRIVAALMTPTYNKNCDTGRAISESWKSA